jgi:hypothetical protein
VSRHIAHADNKRVEAQLLADCGRWATARGRHDFLHNGVTHSNVIADLPGDGRFKIKPALLERVGLLLAGDDAERDAVIADVAALGEDDSGDGAGLGDLPEPMLRRELERIVALEPWNPWWQLKCPMARVGAGLVIVGAHLDFDRPVPPGLVVVGRGRRIPPLGTMTTGRGWPRRSRWRWTSGSSPAS